MDEVRIWDRALSQSEIEANMCGELIGSEDGLVGYWKFNESTGTTIYDLSSSEFDGNLIGGPFRTKRIP